MAVVDVTASAVESSPELDYGSATPRIAPPVPVKHGLAEFVATSEAMGVTLMPWQKTAAKYLTAVGPDGKRLYSEVGIVVARQQGKTTLMKPLIIEALRQGKRIMHIAQSRELPREMFNTIANALAEEPGLFPKRRGKTVWPRYGSGQEEITLANGGRYRIAAAKSGGARGWTNDRVIIDELREVDSWAVIEAAQPTLRMSDDGQMIYLSNAGHDNSIVLNALRKRAGEDPSLAYLEWSAAPERLPDDPAGWREANPAIGHYPSVLRDLERDFTRARLSGNMAGFETESLCRWVATMRDPIVDGFTWSLCEGVLPAQRSVYMGVSMDPKGHRASAVLAWRAADGTIAVRSLLEASGGANGEAIDTDKLGQRLRIIARQEKVLMVGYDPLTDAELAKYLLRSQKITGREFANASSRFALAVSTRKLRWQDADAITDDLVWTAVKPHDESGSYQAVRAEDDHPITAALAAIRAVWMASEPPRGKAGIH